MRSVRRRLEEEILDAAADWRADLRMTIHHPKVARLRDAVDALRRHDLAPITDAPGAHNGRPTSVAAASAPKRGSVRRRILDEIFIAGPPGLTDDDLEHRLHRKHTTVSSARNWLMEAGWLTESGATRITTSGRDAIRWWFTPAAMDAIASPEWIRLQ